MRSLLIASGAVLVLASCLAPDIEIVPVLAAGGFAGLGNFGGAIGVGGSVGGTLNPAGCPTSVPTGTFDICTAINLACDYEPSTRCVCMGTWDCTMSSTGGTAGSGGSSNGGSSSSDGGTTAAGSGGASAGSMSTGGSGGTGVIWEPPPCAATAAASSQIGGGYWMASSFSGYSYTMHDDLGSGTMIAPAIYEGMPADTAPCACGSVAPAYEAVAGIGFNINQPQDGSTPSTIVPGSFGISYSILDWQVGMRLEIHGPNGAVDASERWCMDLAGPSGLVAWEDFRNECWSGTGPAYNREPLREVLILLPGDVVQAKAFDFCVESLYEE